MIRVYFLPVNITDKTIVVSGSELIHDALLECTYQPDARKLIMDTTEDEHTALLTVALSWRNCFPAEEAQFLAQVEPSRPDPDYDRICELLANSPEVITQPEIWELLRHFGKRLGYVF